MARMLRCIELKVWRSGNELFNISKGLIRNAADELRVKVRLWGMGIISKSVCAKQPVSEKITKQAEQEPHLQAPFLYEWQRKTSRSKRKGGGIKM